MNRKYNVHFVIPALLAAFLAGCGYVSGLIFHPAFPDVLSARTGTGGAPPWDHQTSSWTTFTDGLGFSAAESGFHDIESIAIDPANDQLVYMAAGMTTFEGNGRPAISSDHGDHRLPVDLPFPLGGNNNGRAIGERLMFDPNQPSTLFYGSHTAGLWKSTDAGQTWTQVTPLSSARPTPTEHPAISKTARKRALHRS